ncbi:MAG: hypothetical protein LLG04_09835, partial [Parachlamydia sp.]|nr:hypothetical protein [Parachlamydia sp.]
MLEVIGTRQPLNIDAILSPAKKRIHDDRAIQNIANLSLRALISPVKTIQAVKGLGRLAPKRLFEDSIGKENNIPPTAPDISGQSVKKIQSDTSAESKGVEHRLARKRLFE